MAHTNSREKQLFTLDEALNMTRQEVRENCHRYINPSLVDILGLMDFDKLFTKAEGAHVWDGEGHKYLDCLGGYGALNLGHNPPEVLAAIEKVKARPNILQASLNPFAAALAANLVQVTPGELSRVFFCNSGTEAVEGALKLARAAQPEKKKIIYCQNSFHGKSHGSLSVTGREKFQNPFRPLLPDCEAIPFGDHKALEQALVPKNVAAFIVEPIQGEGGINLPPQGYLAKVRKLCDQYDTFLIVDEVQTGLGRTGALFACEHEQVAPDIMCLAKSLGGGVMPIGAYLTKPQIWDRVYRGKDKYALHTSTFGGNSLAMAAGLAALERIIHQNLAQEAKEKGNYLLEKLARLKAKHNLIKDIRGQGLLIGIEFNQPPVNSLVNKLSGGKINELAHEYFASLVAGELMNKYHIITAYTLNNPQVIRLEPPLIIDYPDLDQLITALEEILSQNFSGILKHSLRTILTAKLKK
ncbi:MAG: aspartate aminotransferase family protein [Clostridia bacterium]|nr:aspartate aminotransferase family protein [Clostridia bacterium]